MVLSLLLFKHLKTSLEIFSKTLIEIPKILQTLTQVRQVEDPQGVFQNYLLITSNSMLCKSDKTSETLIFHCFRCSNRCSVGLFVAVHGFLKVEGYRRSKTQSSHLKA